MRTYSVDFFKDDHLEVFTADDDGDAYRQACELEDEFGHFVNIFELNEDYDHIRTVF